MLRPRQSRPESLQKVEAQTALCPSVQICVEAYTGNQGLITTEAKIAYVDHQYPTMQNASLDKKHLSLYYFIKTNHESDTLGAAKKY